MAGRGTATFVDVRGQKCDISLIGTASLSAVKTYAGVVAGKSGAMLKSVSFSTMEQMTSGAAKAGSNVDKRGVVVAQDELGKAHLITIPAIEATAWEETNAGDRVKADVVKAVTAAYKTALGLPSLVGMYGYIIQRK